jgi:hypothetical protein
LNFVKKKIVSFFLVSFSFHLLVQQQMMPENSGRRLKNKLLFETVLNVTYFMVLIGSGFREQTTDVRGQRSEDRLQSAEDIFRKSDPPPPVKAGLGRRRHAEGEKLKAGDGTN